MEYEIADLEEQIRRGQLLGDDVTLLQDELRKLYEQI